MWAFVRWEASSIRRAGWAQAEVPEAADVRHTTGKKVTTDSFLSIVPRHSMYGIFTYIGVVLGVNVGIYGIHGVSGVYSSSDLATKYSEDG